MPHPFPLRRFAPWAWVATLLLAAVLCALTLSPEVQKDGPPGHDKLHHFIGFGVLALPLSIAYPRRAWAVIVGVALFGGMIEVIQPHVGRDAEWGDLLADALGAIAAAIIARLLRRRRIRPG